MNDERFLKDWLRDTTDSTASPDAAADKVVAQLPDTPQRRRWLPWPPIRRRSRTNDDTPPTVKGRTRFMFSPIKAIVAGALALSVGGAFLLTQPIDQQAAIVPGAETEPLVAEVPSVFTGEIHAFGPSARGGWQWTPEGMTDLRLDGTAFYAGSETYPTDDTWLGWWTFRIVNDDGAWQTSFPGFSWGIKGVDDDGLGPDVFTTLFYGEGAYEGLVAVTVIDIYGNPDGWTVNGVIVDADELPEPPAAARPYGSE